MHGHRTWPKRTHGAAFRPSSQPAAIAGGRQRRLHQRQSRHACLSLHTHSRCPPCPAGSGQLSIIGSSESPLLDFAMPSRRPRAKVVAAAATETGAAASSTLPSNGKQQPTARQVHEQPDTDAIAAATAASATIAAETSGRSQRHVLADGEVIKYKDSATDVAFIAVVRKAYARIAGWQSDRAWKDGPESYMGMVEVSKALMKGRTADQQLAAVISGFPQVPPLFRRLFPYSKWGAELNARITPAFFTWLVGPMTTVQVDIDGVTQSSGVHIKRCRYLAESGCAGMCVNLCKRPTQAFFTEQLGMPLSMEPNFEDYSCEMVFGRRPPPPEEDPAFKQGCLALCNTAQAAGRAGAAEKACHKLE